MTSETPFHPEELPAELALFPLPGAVVFPRWSLPLNIFEPRYLNMVDDAMSGTRLIGMVQTTGGPKACPHVAGVGCAGRITSFQETEDARYLIVLTGICRFRVDEIAGVTTPYRQARADWSGFLEDLTAPDLPDVPSREDLTAALKAYVTRNGMEADWSTVDDAPFETLVNALSAGCPFSVAEKQALLEAPTLPDRAQTLLALMEMDTGGEDGLPLQ
jgi:uncharacterized protein